MNDLIARFTSRKFIAAITTAWGAFELAAQDNIITTSEIALIISPIIAFILMEGTADVMTRYTNVPQIETKAPVKKK